MKNALQGMGWQCGKMFPIANANFFLQLNFGQSKENGPRSFFVLELKQPNAQDNMYVQGFMVPLFC